MIGTAAESRTRTKRESHCGGRREETGRSQELGPRWGDFTQRKSRPGDIVNDTMNMNMNMDRTADKTEIRVDGRGIVMTEIHGYFEEEKQMDFRI
ncbi:hypothetical protein V6N12_027830 [Hibiscus sabdariffa]|uniref:Uncharacterized protein n=1 Tax=Hibiscus sabdariffa TaxID=183260 RepID=A0ABR2F418_9ROSI